MPLGDRVTRDAHVRCGGVVADAGPNQPPPGVRATALNRLRRSLFASEAPPAGDVDDTVHVFSAPGESREGVEIVRRVLQEAERGVPFDAMAVLLRAPRAVPRPSRAQLSHVPACRLVRSRHRAARSAGARLPRAARVCGRRSLSARRFAEYVSLGEVPDAGGRAPPEPADPPASVGFDRTTQFLPLSPASRPTRRARADHEAPLAATRPDDRVVAGTLRAPWRWELRARALFLLLFPIDSNGCPEGMKRAGVRRCRTGPSGGASALPR